MSNTTDWVVVKLGGTSQCVAGYNELVKLISAKKNRYVIVLSAISGMTDLLEKYTNTADKSYLDSACLKEITLRKQLELESGFDECLYTTCLFSMEADDKLYEQSRMIGLGEFISTRILYEYLCKCIGNNSSICWASSYDFIKSKKETYKLYPSTQFYGDIDQFNYISSSSDVVICQGFVASTPKGKTILLGRGGSDTTGAIIANMLDAKEYQVWTDVNGIYTCDPRIVGNSKKINSIDYEMAVEIAEMGAKIMHPYSITPCAVKNIPIIIKNTFDVMSGETVINNDITETPCVIATQNNITLFKISSLDMWNSYGFMGDIFRHFSEHAIDVNIVTSSPSSVYTTTDESSLSNLRSVLSELEDKYKVEMIRNCSIVTIVSQNVKSHLDKINLSDINSYIVHFGANNLTINFVVCESDSIELTKFLHSKLVA